MITIFSDIKFDYAEHSYLFKGRKLVSVTTVISRVKQPFDKNRVAASVAVRDNKNVQDVLEEWEKSGEEARDKGTVVHKYIEDVLDGVKDSVLNNVNMRIPEMDAFDNAYIKIVNTLKAKLLLQEITIGDSLFGVAGRVDCLLSIPNEKRETLHIFDWKTGKKFDTSNQYAKMLAPFDDLDDCAFNHYSLQTSLYRLILERNRQNVYGLDTAKKEFGDSYLLHLRPDGSYHLHRAKDYRARITDWLSNGIPEDINYDTKDEEYAGRICSMLEDWGHKNISSKLKIRLGKAVKGLAANIEADILDAL